MLNILTRLGALFAWGSRAATAGDDSDNYFRLATQYYVAGRAATFAGCFPVAGNLFHHAVEMFLKGDLVRDLPRTKLKAHHHNLKRLWRAYKSRHPAVDLSAHDASIKQLHKFEDIRYPDRITDRGMIGTINISRPSPPPSMWSARGHVLPVYHLVVNDIDELVKTIFTTTSVNPDFYFMRVSPEWRPTLHRDNPAFPAA